MYGNEMWNNPAGRRRAAEGEPPRDTNKRYSTGYMGFEAGESSTSAVAGQGRGGHSRNISATTGYGNPGTGLRGDEERTYRDRANQIVQFFFWKAAMVIIQSRVEVEPTLTIRGEKKSNKWFNIELDEMESFKQELRLWRTGDAWAQPRLPPLIIETYLDTSDLSAMQALVISDAAGKRWNVTEALDNAANRGGYMGQRRGGQATSQQVVLERWTVEISPGSDVPHHLDLPVVYKKAIITFRALWSYVWLMPTWKFRRRLQKKLHPSALKVGCRVYSGADVGTSTRNDGLELAFDGDDKVLEEFEFEKTESPAGFLNIKVQFRKNVDFRVDDSETYLSSQFINLDEHHHNRPSRHQRTSSQPSAYASARGSEQGSLPSVANPAYGSLSSFHQAERSGASPISALRTAAEMADRATASSVGSSERLPPSGSVQNSRASLRSRDGIQLPSRRGSINFMQPFKSPSLSNSPANDYPVRQPPGPGALNPHRLSVETSSPSSYKSASSQLPPETGTAPISSSFTRPAPTPRITSSFGTRPRPRVASTTAKGPDDDATSSGQASYTSSAAPGSQLYSVPGASLEDDRQIHDFMKLLADGQTTSLKSFRASSSAEANRNTSNVLSKYQKMRDSHSALADSMSTSLLLQPQSPTSSSRNLSNPGMVPSTFSSSSSPGKPISPHTPHTPAIPSRLSEGSIARYDTEQHSRRQHHRPRNLVSPRTHEPPAASTATTSPLDIPLSPRFMGPRRANSMSQQQREPIDGNSVDYEPLSSYDNRRQSTSLNSADVDNVPLSMSRLLSLSDAKSTALPGRQNDEGRSEKSAPYGPPVPPTLGEEEGAPSYTQASRFPSRGASGSYRNRFSRPRAESPVVESTSSLEKDSRQGLTDRRGNSWSKGEDEELLFAMSDMLVGRKSLEDGSGGVAGGGSTGDSGSSSRRRSRGGGSIGEASSSRWNPPSGA